MATLKTPEEVIRNTEFCESAGGYALLIRKDRLQITQVLCELLEGEIEKTLTSPETETAEGYAIRLKVRREAFKQAQAIIRQTLEGKQ